MNNKWTRAKKKTRNSRDYLQYFCFDQWLVQCLHMEFLQVTVLFSYVKRNEFRLKTFELINSFCTRKDAPSKSFKLIYIKWLCQLLIYRQHHLICACSTDSFWLSTNSRSLHDASAVFFSRLKRDHMMHSFNWLNYFIIPLNSHKKWNPIQVSMDHMFQLSIMFWVSFFLCVFLCVWKRD